MKRETLDAELFSAVSPPETEQSVITNGADEHMAEFLAELGEAIYRSAAHLAEKRGSREGKQGENVCIELQDVVVVGEAFRAAIVESATNLLFAKEELDNGREDSS